GHQLMGTIDELGAPYRATDNFAPLALVSASGRSPLYRIVVVTAAVVMADIAMLALMTRGLQTTRSSADQGPGPFLPEVSLGEREDPVLVGGHVVWLDDRRQIIAVPLTRPGERRLLGEGHGPIAAHGSELFWTHHDQLDTRSIVHRRIVPPTARGLW